jgi:hypothetical protein
MPEFDACYRALVAHHEQIDRLQVPNGAMHEVVLTSGIAADKVHRIPIGVDLALFPLRTDADRRQARAQLGLTLNAFVAGSFQKDGVGMEAGEEPKLIKGPDVHSAFDPESRSTAALLSAGAIRCFARRSDCTASTLTVSGGHVRLTARPQDGRCAEPRVSIGPVVCEQAAA